MDGQTAEKTPPELQNAAEGEKRDDPVASKVLYNIQISSTYRADRRSRP